MFVVQDRRTGYYVKPYSSRPIQLQKPGWTKDINEARIFQRSCDAKNSIRSMNFDGLYKLIPCLIKAEPTEFYKIDCKIGIGDNHFYPFIADSKEQAEEYISRHTCGLHRDYFTITVVNQKPKPKTNGHSRPDWTEYFLGLARVVSRRSHDQHTQHGCVIVDSQKQHILSTGYNGFPRRMNDKTLPLNRPDPAKPDEDNKYNWMLHSEFNACCNLVLPANEHAIAYITGEPCTPCLMCLWQHDVTKVIHRDDVGSHHLINEQTRKRRDILLQQTGMQVIPYKTNLAWLTELAPV